jgi:aryl-alcohol dehydrogenase-like predicted oxidoreductase
MDYRFLGATGLEVSELCLGAMMFGSRTDKQTSTRILDTFTEAGGNFIDSADIYGEGRSEEVLGRWLGSKRREDHIVATKVWGPTGPGRNDRGLSHKHILLDREAEWELLPVCQYEGLGVITWSPLRSGWLSGAYRRGMTAPPPDSKVSQPGSHSWDRYANDHTWHVLDELTAVADEADSTPARVAIRWLLQRPGVTAPIIGARTHAHLDDLLGATGWSLTPEQMSRLDAASEPARLPYPYNSRPLAGRS